MKLILFFLLVLSSLALTAFSDDNSCKPFPEVHTVTKPDYFKDQPELRTSYQYDYGNMIHASSPNGEWTTIFHKATGKSITIPIGKRRIPYNSRYNSITYVPKDSKKTIHISGLNSGEFKTAEYPHEFPTDTQLVSPTGRFAVTVKQINENNNTTYTLEVTDLTTGTTKKKKWPSYLYSDYINFSPDGKYLLANSNSSILAYELETGELLPGRSAHNGNISYEPLGNRFIEIGYDGNITLSPFTPGYHYTDESKSLEIPGVSNCSSQKYLNEDASRMILQCGREVVIIDLKTLSLLGRTQLPSCQASLSLSPNLRYGNAYCYNEQTSMLLQFDENGKVDSSITLPYTGIGYGNDGFSAGEMGGSFAIPTPSPVANTNYFYHLKKVCPIPLDPGKCPNCSTNTVGSLPLDSLHKKWLEEVELAQLCKLPFKSEDWDKSFPKPTSEKISEKELMAYLMRFQKKGGFEYDKHLQLLVTLLNSPLSAKEPQLMLGMLQNINLELPWLYDHLQTIYPFLSDYKVDGKFKNPCRTETEASDLETRITKFLDDRIKAAGSSRDFAYFESLKLYTPILSKLPKADRDKKIEDICDAIKGAAMGNDLLRNVFPSKLFYLARTAVDPLFGQHHDSVVTDLTYERNYNNEIIPIVLGPASIGESKRTRFGFHARKLSPLLVNKEATKDQTFKVRWHQNGERFEGTLKLEHVDFKDIVPTDKAPLYKDLYKDGVMTGAIIVGSNLKSSAVGLLDQYLDYYADQGFTFSQTKTKISDMSVFFKEGVESGHWDYFVKEAHSDGDDKNLFRFDKKSEYLMGEKRNPDGTKEVIYLIYPDASSGGDVLLSNQTFGEWIRKRKKDGKGQVVYFNTSCGSSYKAVREVEAARSSALVDVATSNSALTFSNHSTSAFRAVLDGFRKQKTYEQIRQDMNAIPGYNRSNKDNYLFPDDPQYESSITKNLMPYGIEIGIKDSKGKDYHIDEALRSYHH